MAATMAQEELITDALIHTAVQHMARTASIIVVVLHDIQSHRVIEDATEAGAGPREAQEAVLVTAEVQATDQEEADSVNN